MLILTGILMTSTRACVNVLVQSNYACQDLIKIYKVKPLLHLYSKVNGKYYPLKESSAR